MRPDAAASAGYSGGRTVASPGGERVLADRFADDDDSMITTKRGRQRT